MEKKLRESKDIVLVTSISRRISDSTNVVHEKNSCDVVQLDIAPGDAKHVDISTKILKDIIDKDEKNGRSSLRFLYSKLKDMFEGTSVVIVIEIHTATLDVAKEHAILVNASHEQKLLTSCVPQDTPVASTTFDATRSPNYICSHLEYESIVVKRQILSQYWYRSI